MSTAGNKSISVRAGDRQIRTCSTVPAALRFGRPGNSPGTSSGHCFQFQAQSSLRYKPTKPSPLVDRIFVWKVPKLDMLQQSAAACTYYLVTADRQIYCVTTLGSIRISCAPDHLSWIDWLQYSIRLGKNIIIGTVSVKLVQVLPSL